MIKEETNTNILFAYSGGALETHVWLQNSNEEGFISCSHSEIRTASRADPED